MNDLIAFLRLVHTVSPWRRAQSLPDWHRHILGEATELKHAASPEDIVDEAGDIIACVLSLLISLEGIGVADDLVEQSLQGIMDKTRQRKPWMFDGSAHPTTPEEEHAIWTSNKTVNDP